VKLSEKLKLAYEVIEFLESKGTKEEDMQIVLMSAVGTIISQGNVMAQIQERTKKIFGVLENAGKGKN